MGLKALNMRVDDRSVVPMFCSLKKVLSNMILTLILTLIFTLSHPYPYPFSTPDPDPNPNPNPNSNPNPNPNPNPDPKPNANSVRLGNVFLNSDYRMVTLQWSLKNLWTTEKSPWVSFSCVKHPFVIDGD